MGKMRRVDESDEMICKYIEERQKESRGNGNHELKYGLVKKKGMKYTEIRNLWLRKFEGSLE